MSPTSQSLSPKDTANDTVEKSMDEKPRRKTFKPPKKISARYLYNAGLHYLNRYAASTHQFERVMKRKITRSLKHHNDISAEDCYKLLEETTEKFKELGFLNDTLFANGYMHSLHGRGYSLAKIRSKFAVKGLSNDLFENAIEVNNIAGKELWSAVKYIKRKRKGVFAIRDKEGQYEKDLASLARQGFSYGIAQKALSLDEQEALEVLNEND